MVEVADALRVGNGEVDPADVSRHLAIAMLIAACDGFEWDEGNRYKNWLSHSVSESEAEEAFLALC